MIKTKYKVMYGEDNVGDNSAIPSSSPTYQTTLDPTQPPLNTTPVPVSNAGSVKIRENIVSENTNTVVSEGEKATSQSLLTKYESVGYIENSVTQTNILYLQAGAITLGVVLVLVLAFTVVSYFKSKKQYL
jgi:hypothetical protein